MSNELDDVKNTIRQTVLAAAANDEERASMIALDPTLDAEELERALREQAQAEERAARVVRQNETLEEIGSIIENSKTKALHHYGAIRETVVSDGALVIIGSTDKVLILTPYERDMYTDELQKVANKLAERHGHKLTEWGYTYSSNYNIATCEYCGEPVVQMGRKMPKGASILETRCDASPDWNA